MTKAFKTTRFASIPYELMDVMTERGGKQIICVYLWLHRYGWCSDKGCWASIATISQSTGIKPDHVRQAIQWLLAEGWIVQTPRPGRTSVFFVRMHRDELPLPQKGVPPKGGTTPPPKGGTTPPPKRGTNKNPIKENPVSKTQKAQAPEKDPNQSKKLPRTSIPFELDDCADLLVEFWATKKGTRSSSVLKRICNKLRQWNTDDRRSALERAIASGWGDVFQPRPQAAYSASEAVTVKHPASRVFTAQHGFGDEPVTNPVIQNLF
jgi:hypothetical protein